MEIDLAQTGFNANLAQRELPTINRRVEFEENSAVENANSRRSNNLDDAASNRAANVSNEQADKEGNGSSLAEQDIEVAVSEVRDFVQAQRTNLDFTFNDDSNRSIVQVKDTDTGELIRQIPSEEVLALSDRIRGLQSDVGEAVGVLFSKEV